MVCGGLHLGEMQLSSEGYRGAASLGLFSWVRVEGEGFQGLVFGGGRGASGVTGSWRGCLSLEKAWA